MTRPTNYSDKSYYSRKFMGDGIAITAADKAYRTSMHLSNIEFVRRLAAVRKGGGLIG